MPDIPERLGLAAIGIGGVWLRREGDYAIVAVEVAGQWRDVIRERFDGNFCRIVEPGGIERAPETKLS